MSNTRRVSIRMIIFKVVDDGMITKDFPLNNANLMISK